MSRTAAKRGIQAIVDLQPAHGAHPKTTLPDHIVVVGTRRVRLPVSYLDAEPPYPPVPRLTQTLVTAMFGLQTIIHRADQGAAAFRSTCT